MAPLQASVTSDKRIQTVIDCAAKTVHLLNERLPVPPALVSDIESHTKTLPTFAAPAFTTRVQELDSLGTDLWNASVALLDEDADAPHVDSAVVYTRMFALMLLDSSHHASKRRSKDQSQRARMFKVAVKATRLCLNRNQLEPALTALERCSQYMPTAEASSDSIQISDTATKDVVAEQHTTTLKLQQEYYLLRMWHAWKSARLDLTDHFFHSFSKLNTSVSMEATEITVKAADLFYELGKSISGRGEAEESLKWYERAFTVLGGRNSEEYDQDSAEIRLTVGVAIVDELLANKDVQSHMRTWDIIKELEGTLGLENRIAIQVLKYRVLANEQIADPEKILQPLLRIVKLVVLTQANFKMVMQTLQKANNMAPSSALAALKDFICIRLLPELESPHTGADQYHEWLEKATVTFIFMTTSSTRAIRDGQPETVLDLLDKIKRIPRAQFSTKATHAAQTLLWKATTGLDQDTSYKWCNLLQHPLFDNAGHINKGRIGRKLIQNALERGDLQTARAALFAMPIDLRSEPQTAYLAFKISVKCNDEDLAISSLTRVLKNSTKEPTYLYACVLEAQQSNMRSIAVATLRAILDRRPSGIHLASLLRCSARILIPELESLESNVDAVATEIVSLFEMAANSMDELQKSPNEQWRTECQWWSKNAYNLSVQLCTTVHPDQLVRLLAVCIRFLENTHNDTGLTNAGELSKRKMLCFFLSATALIVLGRSSEGNEEYALQCFLQARQNFMAYKIAHSKLGKQDQDNDINERTFTMLKFELECILKLRQWDGLDAALNACLDMDNINQWDALADLVILIHSHLDAKEEDSSTTQLMIKLLQKMINDTWKKDKSIHKVARWLRFAFVMCLEHTKGNFSLKLLVQAANMAQSGQRAKYDPYPDTELRWLATTGFNHAIDLVALDKHDDANLWMDAALEVARWAADNGSLHAMLTHHREAVKKRLESSDA